MSYAHKWQPMFAHNAATPLASISSTHAHIYKHIYIYIFLLASALGQSFWTTCTFFFLWVATFLGFFFLFLVFLGFWLPCCFVSLPGQRSFCLWLPRLLGLVPGSASRCCRCFMSPSSSSTRDWNFNRAKMINGLAAFSLCMCVYECMCVFKYVCVQLYVCVPECVRNAA